LARKKNFTGKRFEIKKRNMQRSFPLSRSFIDHWREWQSFRHTVPIRLILASAVALQGMFNGLLVLLPGRAGKLATFFYLLEHIAPFVPVNWTWYMFSLSRDIALFLAFFLLLIAFGLARGKKQAWYQACILLPLSIGTHLSRGTGLLSTLPALFLFLALLASQPFFQVRSDPWRCRQGFLLLGAGGLLFLVYSLGGLYLLQGEFAFTENLEELLSGFFLRVLHLHSSAIIPLTGHATWFLQSLSYLSALILVTGLFFLLRPISMNWWITFHKERLEAFRLKAGEMVSQYGGQTLSFFALAPENLPYVAPDGEGLILYRLSGKVAMVPGDPICVPGKFEHVTRSFLTMCRLNDWQVSFYQAHPAHLETYEKLGLRAYKIGEEAIVDLATFTLNGSAMSNVRCTCRRAEREQVRIEWYEGVPPAALLTQLQAVSEAWLAQKAGRRPTEMGFSMGRFCDLTETAQRADLIARQRSAKNSRALPSPRFVTGVAFTKEGRACAFVTFTPLYGPANLWGWALDLIRREPGAPPGSTELLLVRAAERFREQGATIMSLGMIAMADSNQEMSPAQRQVATFATEHLHLLEEHRSLYHFKKKFQPRWESRYIVTSGKLALPRAALAILRVHQA
jgi:lysylphosphatidylglycerol synthetase-like protein (DUF2156 family)